MFRSIPISTFSFCLFTPFFFLSRTTWKMKAYGPAKGEPPAEKLAAASCAYPLQTGLLSPINIYPAGSAVKYGAKRPAPEKAGHIFAKAMPFVLFPVFRAFPALFCNEYLFYQYAFYGSAPFPAVAGQAAQWSGPVALPPSFFGFAPGAAVSGGKTIDRTYSPASRAST
ncbi:MAG: hypothetical protein K6B40_01255 [Firmicutes bacterium]|nr:hypothetical protein [Bacillota bacterium]